MIPRPVNLRAVPALVLLATACVFVPAGNAGTITRGPLPRSSGEPPAQVFMLNLKTYPRRPFGAMRQGSEPKPLWSIPVTNAWGRPTISPDGRWIVTTRTGDWGNNGMWMTVIDLVHRTTKEHLAPEPGIVGSIFFDASGETLFAIVDTAKGHGVARWNFPNMDYTVKELGPGHALASVVTHAGDRIVVRREDGVIVAYTLATGRKIFETPAPPEKPKSWSAALAISPDDSILASGCVQPGNQFFRWRLSDGTPVESPAVQEFREWGGSVTYNRDGSALLVAGPGLTLRDSTTDAPLSRYTANATSDQPGLGLTAAPGSPANTFIVVDTTNGQLRMQARIVDRPIATQGDIIWACLSPDGKFVYTADYLAIQAWDLAAELARRPDWLNAGRHTRLVLRSPDGKSLIAVGETVDTWDLATRKLVGSRPSKYLRQRRGGDREEWITGAKTLGTFTLGGRVFAVVPEGNGGRVIDAVSGEPGVRLAAGDRDAPGLWSAPQNHPTGYVDQYRDWFRPGEHHQMAVSPDGKFLLLCTLPGRTNSAALWSLETGRRVAVLADNTVRPALGRFCADGIHFVVANEQTEIRVFTIGADGAVNMEPVTGPVTEPTLVARGVTEMLMPTPDRLYVGTRDGKLTRWAREQGHWHRLARYTLGAPVARLALSPQMSRLAVCLFDAVEQRSILIIDVATGEIKSRLDDNAVDACFLSETQLASSTIRLWTLD